MRTLLKRVAFLLLSGAILLSAVRLVPATPKAEELPPLPEFYESEGYVVSTGAALDTSALDYAAYKLRQIYERYLTENAGRIYLAIAPDKGSFTRPPEGYVPASVDETAAALLAELDFVQYVDIASPLTLEDYYRTDPHWRQECLLPAAKTLAEAMGVPLSGEYRQETAMDTFLGTYADKVEGTIAPDTLVYLTGEALAACTVWDYENDCAAPLYDMAAAESGTGYDLFLSGSKSLLRLDSPLSATERELVVFRDSFASCLVPLLAESYRTITVVDIRYLAADMVGRFVDFSPDADVLFLYSTLVLNNSRTMK